MVIYRQLQKTRLNICRKTSNEIIDFLDNNEEFLEVHFLPETMNFEKEEEDSGAEHL